MLSVQLSVRYAMRGGSIAYSTGERGEGVVEKDDVVGSGHISLEVANRNSTKSGL